MEDILIAVDLKDRPLGPVTKTEAHGKSVLHRAFSVILVDEEKRILMQKRALSKYHCGGLWSNTCCSHPLWGEDMETCVYHKLAQELGITSVKVRGIGEMYYYFPFPNGLAEYEYDHIFAGRYSGEVRINPDEVESVRWMKTDEIFDLALRDPKAFTPWFIRMLPFAEEAANGGF